MEHRSDARVAIVGANVQKCPSTLSLLTIRLCMTVSVVGPSDLRSVTCRLSIEYTSCKGVAFPTILRGIKYCVRIFLWLSTFEAFCLLIILNQSPQKLSKVHPHGQLTN